MNEKRIFISFHVFDFFHYSPLLERSFVYHHQHHDVANLIELPFYYVVYHHYPKNVFITFFYSIKIELPSRM